MRTELDQIIDEGWEWYTSNSYRRLGLSDSYQEIMYATTQSDGHPDIQFKSDAVKNLIEAAPSLYKALKEMVELIESGDEHGWGSKWHKEAVAALNVAEGKEKVL